MFLYIYFCMLWAAGRRRIQRGRPGDRYALQQVTEKLNCSGRKGNIIMNRATARENIKPGASVGIVLKQDQRSGKITRGIVKRILTNSSNHPHGIKVELEDGRVGRVKEIHA